MYVVMTEDGKVHEKGDFSKCAAFVDVSPDLKKKGVVIKKVKAFLLKKVGEKVMVQTREKQ